MIDKLLWVDVETTGLDANKDVLLEVGMVVTNLKLEAMDGGIWLRKLSDPEWDIFSDADEFVLNMHKKNGLIEEITSKDASNTFTDEWILDAIQSLYQRNNIDKTVPMCGSSLRLDRNFLDRYFPAIAGPPALSYRSIDVSTFKESLRRYLPDTVRMWEDQFTEEDKAHRPLLDIKYSISEYKFYLERLGLL